VWNTPELQQFEEKVDALVCHYHPALYAKYQNSAYSKVTLIPTNNLVTHHKGIY
jgi:predicted RNase H-like nuclease